MKVKMESETLYKKQQKKWKSLALKKSRNSDKKRPEFLGESLHHIALGIGFITIFNHLASLLVISPSYNVRVTRVGALPDGSLFYLQHLEQCMTYNRHQGREGDCLYMSKKSSLGPAVWGQTGLWVLPFSRGYREGQVFRRDKTWSFLVTQQVKDLELSLPWLWLHLWCMFDPWPGNFCMLWMQPKKEELKPPKHLTICRGTCSLSPEDFFLTLLRLQACLDRSGQIVGHRR